VATNGGITEQVERCLPLSQSNQGLFSRFSVILRYNTTVLLLLLGMTSERPPQGLG